MSTIIFDNRRFFYTGDDGCRQLLLDISDIYGNHSAVSMMQVEEGYGQLRQEKPFKAVLMKHLEILKKDADKPFGYVLVLLLLMRELLKKPRPLQVLRVGGSASDLFSLSLAEILQEFHPDSLLCCMSSDDNRSSVVDNIICLPMNMKGVQLKNQQFSALLLDDMGGEIVSETVAGILPALQPWGQFFCLTAKEDLIDACCRALPDVERLNTEGAFSLLVQECTYDDWAKVWGTTSEGRLSQEKMGIGLNLDWLCLEVESLEQMEESRIERMMQHAKELEVSLADIYPSLASVDAKMLAVQFRETLIDWHLGNAGVQRVRAGFAALRDELLRYHDIPCGNVSF